MKIRLKNTLECIHNPIFFIFRVKIASICDTNTDKLEELSFVAESLKISEKGLHSNV